MALEDPSGSFDLLPAMVTAAGLSFVVTALFSLVLVVDAFRRSRELTDGTRLSLFALGVAVFGLQVLVNGGLSVAVAGGGPVGAVVAQVGSALVSVFGVCVLTEAYRERAGVEAIEPGESAFADPGSSAVEDLETT